MFMPFTNDEIESIRSIVLLGQQNNDMLLSNCSTRPIVQTRSFIQRFKRLLLDTQTSVKDITKSANEQYVAIIAGVRFKKLSKNNHLPNATSVANLSSPLLKIPRSVPHKFFSKFAKYDDEAVSTTQNLPPPIPTRSRSISDGLSHYDQPFESNTNSTNTSSKVSASNSTYTLTTTKFTKKQPTTKPITMPNIDFRNYHNNAHNSNTNLNNSNFSIYFNPPNNNPNQTMNNNINYPTKSKALPQPQFVSQSSLIQQKSSYSLQNQYFNSYHGIPIAPPPLKKFPRACNSAHELTPGILVALFVNHYDPAYICRVLGSRNINGAEHVLVSFFQIGFHPIYVLPQQLAILPTFVNTKDLIIPEPLTVDSLLENITQTAQSIVLDNDVQDDIQINDLLDEQRYRELQFKSLVCASYLVFLDFFSKYKVPKEKVDLILNSIDLMNPPKYTSAELNNRKCKELINKIVSLIEKHS